MKVNNKVLLMISVAVLIVFVGLTAYFKANPVITEEPSVPVIAEGPILEVNVTQNDNHVSLEFTNNYVFTNPDEAVDFTYGVTVEGSSEFNLNNDTIEFTPNSNGDMYTLNVTPNISPTLDPTTVTTNYESTFTNAEYIEAENKIVIYFGGTFTFTADNNTTTHDINENFEINLNDYLQ